MFLVPSWGYGHARGNFTRTSHRWGKKKAHEKNIIETKDKRKNKVPLVYLIKSGGRRWPTERPPLIFFFGSHAQRPVVTADLQQLREQQQQQLETRRKGKNIYKRSPFEFKRVGVHQQLDAI